MKINKPKHQPTPKPIDKLTNKKVNEQIGNHLNRNVKVFDNAESLAQECNYDENLVKSMEKSLAHKYSITPSAQIKTQMTLCKQAKKICHNKENIPPEPPIDYNDEPAPDYD